MSATLWKNWRLLCQCRNSWCPVAFSWCWSGPFYEPLEGKDDVKRPEEGEEREGRERRREEKGVGGNIYARELSLFWSKRKNWNEVQGTTREKADQNCQKKRKMWEHPLTSERSMFWGHFWESSTPAKQWKAKVEEASSALPQLLG